MEGSLPSLSGMYVLVVDDNETARYVLRRVLEHCGALVTTSVSARAALATLARFRPDVVVTDLSMPDDDGYWLIGELRRLPPEEGGRIPALAVTASGADARERALASGFQELLPKPLDVRTFCKTVEKLAASAAAP